MSVIEMNDSIISASKDNTLRRWNKSTYECTQIIQDVNCCWCNALEELNNHTVLIGEYNGISIVDIESSEIKKLEDHTLGLVFCFRVIRNDLVLFGNRTGEIIEYNPISNQIISRTKFHNELVCLIETEDNKIISSSEDGTLKIYKYDCSV